MDEFEGLDKEQLILIAKQQKQQIDELQKHKNENKNQTATTTEISNGSGKSRENQKPFDMSKYTTRHVAFKIAYFGWDFQGFALQEHTKNTVEQFFWDALEKTRLIENRKTAYKTFAKCGRTDAGVSAIDQVRFENIFDLSFFLISSTGCITARPLKNKRRRRYRLFTNCEQRHSIWC